MQANTLFRKAPWANILKKKTSFSQTKGDKLIPDNFNLQHWAKAAGKITNPQGSALWNITPVLA